MFLMSSEVMAFCQNVSDCVGSWSFCHSKPRQDCYSSLSVSFSSWQSLFTLSSQKSLLFITLTLYVLFETPQGYLSLSFLQNTTVDILSNVGNQTTLELIDIHSLYGQKTTILKISYRQYTLAYFSNIVFAVIWLCMTVRLNMVCGTHVHM